MTIADGWGWMLVGIWIGLYFGELLSYFGVLKHRAHVTVVLEGRGVEFGQTRRKA